MIRPFAIAIHGGAGTLSREEMTPDKEAAYKDGLRQALQAGVAVLEMKKSALDAVEAAVRALEDHPLFNAGRGAAFNYEGKNELDAAIMNGATRQAGAVACVKGIRNPVRLARAVMEKSDHVLLSGVGAEEFARLHQIEQAPDSYFYTQERYDQLQKKKEKGGAPSENINGAKAERFGTVGAVALDASGHLAVATSTGGLTNKRFGRVGDSPLIGGGTYANENVAVSCTGDGEYFIRTVAAYDVACLIEYKSLSLQEACEMVVQEKLTRLGGEGGLIALDARGNLALPFNSEGMYRAWQRQNETPHIEIF